MPILEYKCPACGRTSSFLTKSIGIMIQPACQACGSSEMRRAISSFAHHRSTRDIHQASGPPSQHLDWDRYKDPRNIGRTVEDTFKEWNVEVPSHIRETIDAAREGTMPKEVDF